MTQTQESFVIVGSGLAGAETAEGLRKEAFDGRVILLGAENARPYDRPPLSGVPRRPCSSRPTRSGRPG